MTAVVRATGFALLFFAFVGVTPSQGLTQAEKTVFYSGQNHDGENSGKDAGAWVMVETAFDEYEIWKGTTKCNSNRAVPRKPKRVFTRLAGYSLGRLGPAYYLQQMEQRKVKSDIRGVLLLDPGVADEFECDNKSGAGYTYATWLRQNPSNRLVIITGGRSDDDGYKGLRETYLDKLTAQTVGPNVGDRVLVCDAPSIKHTRVDEAWKHLIGASSLPKSCPPATTLSQYSPKSEPGAPPPPSTPDAPPPGTTGTPRVALGQGPAAPNGYRYAVSISGFPAGSSVTIVCRDSVDPGGFFSFAMTADGAGNSFVSNQCYSGDGPDHWVTANGIESNHVTWGSGGGPAPQPQPQPPSSAQIVVDNRVTNGASTMREDTPAYLSTVTRNFCKRDGCSLPGTDMGSGAVITAECTTLGHRTTNGQDNSAIDDGNPGLYTSSRWYGIRWGDGRFGFIAEVWIAATYRGGLGLRGC